MTLSEILSTVNELSHQDKLRLIHFLLLAVAKEEGCSLETSDAENILLNQLASTSATVWSPQADNRSIQALSDLAQRLTTQNTHPEQPTTLVEFFRQSPLVGIAEELDFSR